MLKTTILTQLIENLTNVQRFISDEKRLVESVVDEEIRLLHMWATDLSSLPVTEVLGGKKLAATLETLEADPHTREVLSKVCEAALLFIQHYAFAEATAQAVRNLKKTVN